MPKQKMLVFYVNKTKFEPQATGQKSEIKIFNWVTLSTIFWFQIYGHFLLSTKMCSFVNVINE